MEKDDGVSGSMVDMELAVLRESALKASSLLKAMANEHRLMILCQIGSKECSVGELVKNVGLSQSALSQHLARLRRDQLVRTRRDAQTIYYRLASPEVHAVIETLYGLYCAKPAAAKTESKKDEASLLPAA